MKYLDVIKLIEDFSGISAGTNGTIVLGTMAHVLKWSLSMQREI